MEDRDRIEGKLDQIATSQASCRAQVIEHQKQIERQLQEIHEALECMRPLKVRVALLEAAEERQRWWQRTMIGGMLVALGAAVASFFTPWK